MCLQVTSILLMVLKDQALAHYLVGSTAVVVTVSASQITVAECGGSTALRLCSVEEVKSIPLILDHKLTKEDGLMVHSAQHNIFRGCCRSNVNGSQPAGCGNQHAEKVGGSSFSNRLIVVDLKRPIQCQQASDVHGDRVFIIIFY